MSEKQLGAAPGEEGEPVAGKRVGWFGRLRGQPGFRTASVAFVLTVVLGIGSTAAYAYWSKRTDVAITGTTARQPLPLVTGEVKCHQPFGVGVVQVAFARVAALPEDANVLASVVGPGRQTRLYAIPNDGFFVVKELPGLEKSLSWGDRLSITVTTAYIDTPPENLPALVDPSRVLTPLTTAPKPTNAYYLASFFC